MSEKVAVGLIYMLSHLKSVTTGMFMQKLNAKHIGRTTSLWNVEITDEETR